MSVGRPVRFCTLALALSCGAGEPPATQTRPLAITHSFDLATHMPPHLAVMYSMSWFGISPADPQGAGPDPSYGNGAVSNGCTGAQSDPAACDTCILMGAGDACIQNGAPQRRFASRRRPLAGIYSASARDAEGRARVDLMLSNTRRSCDDGAKLDAWAVQLNGTRGTSLHPGNPSCDTCNLAWHALLGFFARADAGQLTNVVMPGQDSTWYFHFGGAVALGNCDDTPGNPRQNCLDALTQDFTDMATEAVRHPSARTVNGAPLFLVYLDPAQASPSEWKTLLDNARNASGHDFYVVGMLQNPTRSGYFAAFDALAPWVQLDFSAATGADMRARGASYAANLHGTLYTDVGSYPGRVVFGGVSPGFDDFTENWGGCVERQLPPGDARNPAFLTGQFDHLVTRMAKGVVLQTWDDWTEGTEFEPDVAGGSSMLVSLRGNLGRLYGEPADPAGDAALMNLWASYGQARNCSGGTAGTPPRTRLDCPAATPDLGAGARDGGTTNDAGRGADGGTHAGAGTGCSCSLSRAAQPGRGPLLALALAAVALLVSRRRGRA